MNDPIPTAFSYVRFSSRKQEEGDSLRRQTQLAEEWSKRNGIPLDRSRKWHDLGRSAYLGEHRNNPDRNALAAFLKMVEEGRIAKGSYLVIENLDRLTREDIQPALSLVLGLLQAGIRIVQLTPETVFDSQSNAMALMLMICELQRGNSESARKSERVGKAWRQKKELARQDKTPIGKQVPSWVRLVGKEHKLIPSAADVVRRIFAMAAGGYGLTAIARKLNSEKVPPIGKAKRSTIWARSYVAKVLNNRAVLGEYQPHTGNVGRDRKPVGAPIEGYYPAAITLDEWHAAHAGLAQRKRFPGRPVKGEVNLFTGLVFDAIGGGSMNRAQKGAKHTGAILIPYRGLLGEGLARSFPFAAFEGAILTHLNEIDPQELIPADGNTDAVKESLVLAGRLAEVEAELAQIVASLNEKYSPALDGVLRGKEAIRADLIEQQRELGRKSATPLSESWGECKGLLSTLKNAADPNDARLRLRSAIRRLIESIWILVVPRGRYRLAAVQVRFAETGRTRNYLILHEPGHYNCLNGTEERRQAKWYSRSLTDADDLDLRQRDHAAALAASMAELDLAPIMSEPGNEA